MRLYLKAVKKIVFPLQIVLTYNSLQHQFFLFFKKENNNISIIYIDGSCKIEDHEQVITQSYFLMLEIEIEINSCLKYRLNLLKRKTEDKARWLKLGGRKL